VHNNPKRGLSVFLHAFHGLESPRDSDFLALAVVPIGKKTVTQKLIDAPPMFFHRLLAFGQPLSREEGHFVGRQRFQHFRGLNDICDE